jgi:hypothetical protein
VALGAPVASADPPSAPPAAASTDDDARARLAAAALEAAAARMRTLVERAEILRQAGRGEEALAALAEAEKVHADALAVAERALAAPARPVLVRIGPGAPSRAEPVPSRADVDAAREAAVRFLVSSQGSDGTWHPSGEGERPEGALPSPAAATETAWAVLALLDARDDDLREATVETPAARAVRAGAAALARFASIEVEPHGDRMDGAMGEAHVLSTWALAAAYGRTGDADLRAALDRSLDEVVEATTERPRVWLGRDDRWRLAPWVAAALHEALPLDRMSRAAAVERALSALADAALPLAEREGGGFGAALVLRSARREVPGVTRHQVASGASVTPGARHRFAGDEAGGTAEVLLGTVYHAHSSPDGVLHGWSRTRLAPLATVDPSTRLPAVVRHDSVRETAMGLLALLAPDTPWREPVAAR